MTPPPPPLQWRWVESKKLADLDFKFQEKAEPADYVSDLAGRMQLYPPTDVLAAPYLFEEWDPEPLRGLILELRPERVVAFVISSSFKRSQLKKREPWYGTPYAEDMITPSQLRAWASPRKEVTAHFVLPPRNTFIPTDLSIRHRAKGPPTTKPTTFPTAVADSGKLRLWYAPDDLYNRPRANLYFAFRAPTASASPRDRILSLLFCDAFADAFKEESYPARVAGIAYSLDTTGTGFSLLVSGYNDRIIDFLSLLFQRLRAVSVRGPLPPPCGAAITRRHARHRRWTSSASLPCWSASAARWTPWTTPWCAQTRSPCPSPPYPTLTAPCPGFSLPSRAVGQGGVAASERAAGKHVLLPRGAEGRSQGVHRAL